MDTCSALLTLQAGQVAREADKQHGASGESDLAALVEGLGTGEDADMSAPGQKLEQDDAVVVTAGECIQHRAYPSSG